MQTLPFPVLRLIYCLLPGLLLAPNVSNAQNTVPNPVIDSLKQVIATTEVDSVKGRTLCRLCQLQRRSGGVRRSFSIRSEGFGYRTASERPFGRRGVLHQDVWLFHEPKQLHGGFGLHLEKPRHPRKVGPARRCGHQPLALWPPVFTPT